MSRFECSVVAIATALSLSAASTLHAATPATLIGTWTGTSLCVGHRPACRDETVVYRFVSTGKRTATLYADKILQGKRVAMGAFEDMALDAAARKARVHFTRGHTSGTWSFSMQGDDALTGELRIDPDNALGRNVRAHRVADRDVPPAPPPSDYAGS
jgi:hypothetical protein